MILNSRASGLIYKFRSKQDDFVVINTPNEYDTVLEMVFKTEFLTLLSDKYRTATGKDLRVNFSDSIDFKVKKVSLV